MKPVIVVIALALFLVQPGCRQTTEPSAPDIYVSFEAENVFQNDSVKIILDDKVLAQQRITTNYTVNLAWSSGLVKLSREKHILSFVVSEVGTQRVYVVDTTNDTSTVLIRCDKVKKEITFSQIKGRLLRD